MTIFRSTPTTFRDHSTTTTPYLIYILFAWEFILIAFILRYVSYTEIDFSTYMQIVRMVFLEGNMDYSQLTGASGPIAYPAGFLYTFEVIRRLGGDDHNLFMAQICFALLYIAQLSIVFAIYQHCKMPPIAYILATLSRRLHSIFILRMFNDCVTMTLMYGCILLMIKRRWILATILFSLALSTKMNVLLFWPAMVLIYLRQVGIFPTLALHALILVSQILLGAPFLINNAYGYLSIAFNLGRRFQWTWTVNWRFIGKEGFEFLQSSPLPTIMLAVALLVWANYTWLRPVGGLVQFARSLLWRSKKLDHPLDGELAGITIGRWLFQANLLGMIFSKSLHPQFYSWYCWSIPFLLLAGDGGKRERRTLPTILYSLLFVGIEACWNVFPSTWWSSALLFLLNCSLLLISELSNPIRKLVAIK